MDTNRYNVTDEESYSQSESGNMSLDEKAPHKRWEFEFYPETDMKSFWQSANDLEGAKVHADSSRGCVLLEKSERKSYVLKRLHGVSDAKPLRVADYQALKAQLRCSAGDCPDSEGTSFTLFMKLLARGSADNLFGEQEMSAMDHYPLEPFHVEIGSKLSVTFKIFGIADVLHGSKTILQMPLIDNVDRPSQLIERVSFQFAPYKDQDAQSMGFNIIQELSGHSLDVLDVQIRKSRDRSFVMIPLVDPVNMLIAGRPLLVVVDFAEMSSEILPAFKEHCRLLAYIEFLDAGNRKKLFQEDTSLKQTVQMYGSVPCKTYTSDVNGIIRVPISNFGVVDVFYLSVDPICKLDSISFGREQHGFAYPTVVCQTELKEAKFGRVSEDALVFPISSLVETVNWSGANLTRMEGAALYFKTDVPNCNLKIGVTFRHWNQFFNGSDKITKKRFVDYISTFADPDKAWKDRLVSIIGEEEGKKVISKKSGPHL